MQRQVLYSSWCAPGAMTSKDEGVKWNVSRNRVVVRPDANSGEATRARRNGCTAQTHKCSVMFRRAVQFGSAPQSPILHAIGHSQHE